MKFIQITALLALATNPLYAEDLTVAAKVGTLGLGIEGSYAFSDRWGIRAGINHLNYSFEDDLDGVEYDGDLELGSITLLGDFRPWSGGFRISGGVVLNDNRITGVADPDATYLIDDTVYTINEVGTLSADTDFDSVSPYLGLGYDWAITDRVDLIFDLGALFQGDPDVAISSVGGTLSGDPDLRADLDAEEAFYREDLEEYDPYLVASIGLQFRF
ncbi:MAG: hypothetical protein AAF270_15935 [Pseudomonadota bacterium]